MPRSSASTRASSIGLAFGGTDYDKQRNTLRTGIDLLIGTPGRIIDYFKQGVFKLDQVEVAILDEADRMFDLGFIKDIRYLLRRLPIPTSASICCSPRRCRSASWNSPTNT